MKISTKHMTALYNLSSIQFNALEMHSFLNLINIISLQLELLQSEFDHRHLIKPLLDQTKELTVLIKKRLHREYLPDHIQKLEDSVLDLINELEKTHTDDSDFELAIKEAREIFEDVFKVMEVRIAELTDYIKKPSKWLFYTKTEFEQDFNLFFHAVEKNSRGKYRIVHNIAEQEPTDYLIRFEINSELDGERLAMPIIFKDVIRDLIANARKYTPPGGTISILIHQTKKSIKFTVSDDGVGIPANEMDHVFEYGYRGSNVKDRPTMGGGFGLTKALYTTVQFNGDMWIDSELNNGTSITIELPVPDKLLIQE